MRFSGQPVWKVLAAMLVHSSNANVIATNDPHSYWGPILKVSVPDNLHSFCMISWYDVIWYDMIWYDMIWYDMIWYDMIWYDMIWYDMIWYDVIWYDMMMQIPRKGKDLATLEGLCWSQKGDVWQTRQTCSSARICFFVSFHYAREQYLFHNRWTICRWPTSSTPAAWYWHHPTSQGDSLFLLFLRSKFAWSFDFEKVFVQACFQMCYHFKISLPTLWAPVYVEACVLMVKAQNRRACTHLLLEPQPWNSKV